MKQDLLQGLMRSQTEQKRSEIPSLRATIVRGENDAPNIFLPTNTLY